MATLTLCLYKRVTLRRLPQCWECHEENFEKQLGMSETDQRCEEKDDASLEMMAGEQKRVAERKKEREWQRERERERENERERERKSVR